MDCRMRCRTAAQLLAPQEVLALTLIVAGGKPAEIAAHFKEAFQRYTTASGTRAPRSGVRAATRTMLLLADYCRALGHHGEANYALMKAHFQVSAQRSPMRLSHAWMLVTSWESFCSLQQHANIVGQAGPGVTGW